MLPTPGRGAGRCAGKEGVLRAGDICGNIRVLLPGGFWSRRTPAVFPENRTGDHTENEGKPGSEPKNGSHDVITFISEIGLNVSNFTFNQGL